MKPPYPDLSEDDETAFLQLEREFRQTLDEDVRRDGRDPLRAQLSYVNKVLAAADALNIALLSHLTRPETPLVKGADNVHHLRDEIDHALVALRLKSSRRDPIKPARLPEDIHHRLTALIENISAEIADVSLPHELRAEVDQVLVSLRRHIDQRDIRMEHFVDLGREIATIGRQADTEAVADKCWRALRVAMDLVSQAKGTHRPFAHLNSSVGSAELNGHAPLPRSEDAAE